MKCYAELLDNKFTYYIEGVPEENETFVTSMFMQKVGDRFIKEYGMNEYIEPELLNCNYCRLVEKMVEDQGKNWENALLFWIEIVKNHDIEWYLRGSAVDAVRGARIVPHDLDIAIHTRDFFKIKDIFRDYVIEPFIDNHGTWVVRFFGRLCLEKVMVDVDADESDNAENYEFTYEEVQWHGHTILMEPFEKRYHTEILRGRIDRIEKLDELREKSTK